MEKELEDKVRTILIEYAKNNREAKALASEITEMRDKLAGLEKRRAAASEALEANRNKERAMLKEVEESGADMEAFKAEIMEVAKKMAKKQ
jgi:chromosome segregation ATPase